MYRTVVLVISAISIGYFRTEQPQIVAVWGNKDLFFRVPGANKRDNPSAEVHLYALATLLWKLIIPKSPASGIPAGRKLAPQVRAA